MAKKESNPETDALAKAEESDKLALVEVLSALSFGEDFDTSEWKVGISGGADHYWPADTGMKLKGIVLSVDERTTSLPSKDGKGYQMARFYTVQLTAPCVGVTRDGEIVELQAGGLISVLERTMLRKLEDSLGKEIVLICDGMEKTKRGLSLWRYRSWERNVVSNTPATA